MFLSDTTDIKKSHKIQIKCDFCDTVWNTRFSYAMAARATRHSDKDACKSCVCKLVDRPQSTVASWTEERRKNLGNAIRNSEKHKKYIKTRDITAANNGMYGKKHKLETRQKMSISRTGKIGQNATG